MLIKFGITIYFSIAFKSGTYNDKKTVSFNMWDEKDKALIASFPMMRAKMTRRKLVGLTLSRYTDNVKKFTKPVASKSLAVN